MRIKILGPDWKETVLDESRWRHDLYKTWLVMLDEGVGENPLYADRPDPSRRARRPRPRRREDIIDSRRTRERVISRTDERPRRPRKNFSDLEDSLLRNGDFEDDMFGVRPESRDRSVMDDGYSTGGPYEQESPPRRRRRRTR